MSESTRGSGPVKLVLAIGLVLALLMVIGFAGVFFILKYQDDQVQQAAKQEQIRQEQERIRQEREENSKTLGAIGSVLGESIGKQVGDRLGNSSDAELVEKAAAKLGESLGKEMGSRGSKKFVDSLEAAKDAIEEGLRKRAETSDSSADTPADPGSSESDTSPN